MAGHNGAAPRPAGDVGRNPPKPAGGDAWGHGGSHRHSPPTPGHSAANGGGAAPGPAAGRDAACPRQVCKVKKMEPEFAAKSTRARKPVVSEIAGSVPEGAPQGAAPKVEKLAAPTGGGKIKCWKCDKPGHRHSECKSEAKRMCCYRCVMRDVTVRNCFRCKRKGEDQYGASGTGRVRTNK
jgi:hypothetical protein